MRNYLRKSGIDVVGDVPWGTHICQFIQTKEDLIDILVPYFKEGLENNEFCLWITSQPLEVEAAIEALSRVVPDLDVYLEKGQIEIISYNDWFLTEGVFDPERVSNGCAEKLSYALNNGYEGVRLCGSNSWLDKENWDSFIKFKEQMDNVIGNCQMIALCTYSLDRHSVDEIIYLSVNHQFTLVKSNGKWKHIKSYKRKIAEETVIRATKDWEYTFDAVPDFIAIIDTDYKVVRANKAMASKLGMKPEECIGLTCYSIIHGTTRPPSFCPHKQLLKDGFEHTAEACEDCLGGYFIISVSPLYDSEGKLIGSIHVARDINERRQIEEALRDSEEKFRSIVETANEGIIIVDAEARISYANDKLAKMLGNSRETMIGKSVFDFADENSKTILKMNLNKRKQEINQVYELGLICNDGSLLCSLVSAKACFNKDGKFTGSLGMLTDITERKEAESKLKETLNNLDKSIKERTSELEKAYNSLKESEKGLAEAQRMANVGNMDWNLATGEVYWSNELYRIFGRNPQESGAAYEEFLTYVHPDDRDSVKNATKKALNGKPIAGDYRIILANGEERKVHTYIEVIFDEENTPIQVKGTVQDITELKKAEEKIRNLANIVESSSNAIGTISLEDTITSWNKGAEQVYGYSAEEILGKPTTCVAPPHLSEETKKLSERVKKGESINNYETLRQSKDGKIIDVSITLSPVYDLHGKLSAISFISRDITERKKSEEKLRESEEKYRNVVETANEGILIIDKDAIVTYTNKRMADMLGYIRGEGFGRPIWDFISEESKALVKLNLEKRRLGVEDSYELKLIRKDGSPLWTQVNAKALFDKEGKFMGSVSMFTDITRRKEAEQTLAEIEIARKKEIHHRIKNNLQVISSLLDLQADKFRNRKDIKDSEVLEAFRESQDRVISMALIHEELYRGGGFEKLNFSPYVEELAENIFQTYRLGKENINLKLNLEEKIFFDIDVSVPLGMIINELVSNSFKHAFKDRNEGEIQIKLCREENRAYFDNTNESLKSTTFALTVSDNGVGFPENLVIEELDSLGLQLVTSLVDQLDGELEINRKNRTEFIIRFTVTEKTNQVSVPISHRIVNKTCT